MADFWQNGISTLHLLKQPDSLAHLDSPLREYVRERPLTLILPCHARELDTETLPLLILELCALPWVTQIIIGLDEANLEQYARARRLVAPLGERCSLLWYGSEAWKEPLEKLRELEPALPNHGKGRNLWLCMGWMLLHGLRHGVAATMDCDIKGFHPAMLARLVYPVLREDLGYQFCKGYYARHSDRLHGRLMRLLIQPFLSAWEEEHRSAPLTTFLQQFRYALSGEMCFQASLAAKFTFPAGYGVELGILGNIFDLAPKSAVCQSGLCAAFEHRHQPLQSGDGSRGGLEASAMEILATLYLLLGKDPPATFPASFRQHACRALHHAVSVSAINGLDYDLESESRVVKLLGKCLDRGKTHPLCLLPPWGETNVLVPKES
jgi:glucosyl-3-phosphoglycerate synthase